MWGRMSNCDECGDSNNYIGKANSYEVAVKRIKGFYNGCDIDDELNKKLKSGLWGHR